MAQEITTSYRNSTVRLWNSVDVSLLESDLVLPGVANLSGDDTDCKVVAAGTPDNTVKVKVGRVYIGGVDDGQEDEHTERLQIRTERSLTVPANALGTVRVDAVIARIDVDSEPDAESDNNGTVQLITGDGVTALDDAEIQAAVGDDAWYRLANIETPNGFATITNADIVDTREPAKINLFSMKEALTGTHSYYEATGSSGNFEVTLDYPLDEIPDGLELSFKANHQIVGAADIEITDSRGRVYGPYDLVKDGTLPLESSDILEDMVVRIQFDGTNFQLLSPIRAVATSPLDSVYGDGSDGALNVTSGTTQIDCTGEVNGLLIKQYTTFNVSVGATLEFINVPSYGITFVPICQGSFTNAGTIDGAGDGTLGGAGVTQTRTSNGAFGTDGNDATEVHDALRFGQQRKGIKGARQTTNDGGSGVYAAASGASSGANSAADGNASSAATDSIASAGAVSGGVSLTTALLKLIANSGGISLAPGAGGGSGSLSYHNNGYSSGSFVATSQNGGRGGASMLVICGGDYTMSGTINLSGTAAAGASTASAGTNAGTNQGHANAAGGSAGGAAGCFLALVRAGQTITNSGTYTLTGGSGANGAETESGTGGGAGSRAANSAGASGPNGVSAVMHLPL